MKKLVSIILVAFFSSIVFSQKTTYGITAGLQNLKVTASMGEIDSSTDQNGFYLGSFVNMNIAGSVDFQPAIQIAVVDDESYVTFPLMLRYNISDKYNLQCGPQFTYFTGSVGVKDGNFEYELVKRFSTGFAFGGGFNFTDKIFLEVRYNIGLSDITGDDMDRFIYNLTGTNFTGKQKLGGFQVGVGYKIL